jgi:hypothetical protein
MIGVVESHKFFQHCGSDPMSFLQSAKAVVTDAHFLIPVAVLLVGIGLLVVLH